MANNHRAVKYLPDNYPEANYYKTIFKVSAFHSYTKNWHVNFFICTYIHLGIKYIPYYSKEF